MDALHNLAGCMGISLPNVIPARTPYNQRDFENHKERITDCFDTFARQDNQVFNGYQDLAPGKGHVLHQLSANHPAERHRAGLFGEDGRPDRGGRELHPGWGPDGSLRAGGRPGQAAGRCDRREHGFGDQLLGGVEILRSRVHDSLNGHAEAPGGRACAQRASEPLLQIPNRHSEAPGGRACAQRASEPLLQIPNRHSEAPLAARAPKKRPAGMNRTGSQTRERPRRKL